MSNEQQQAQKAEEKVVIDLMRKDNVGAAQLYPAFNRLVGAKVILLAPGGPILADAFR